jgi:hypothetical protein
MHIICYLNSLTELMQISFGNCFYTDQVKEDEMSRACSTNGGYEECI